jgi:hypothetical protein
VTLAAADTVGRNFIPESMNRSASKPNNKGWRRTFVATKAVLERSAWCGRQPYTLAAYQKENRSKNRPLQPDFGNTISD